MERGKLINIQLVFKILEFVVNFDNSVRVTCVSYIGLLALATGRLQRAEFLSNSTFLYVCITVAK